MRKVLAGMTWSIERPTMDFETRSDAGYVWDEATKKWDCLPGAPSRKKGLPVVGIAVYARHPTTEVLSMQYDLLDGRGARLWRPGMPNPEDLFAVAEIEAHGATFEYWIWNEVCVKKYGWPVLDVRRIFDSMAKCRAFSLPGSLEKAGDALDIASKKDKDGKRLLVKFSIPRNPTKDDPRTHVRLDDEPEDAAKLFAYNERDVVAEHEVSLKVPELSAMEDKHWRNDQAINLRGVEVDVAAIDDCIVIVNQVLAKYGDELKSFAGCSPSQIQKLRQWLEENGCVVESLDQEAVEEALSRPHLPPHVRRALEIRAAAGSASVKKVFAMKNQQSRGRLHNLYNFHGARTGRPTGEGPQPTNLPKAGPNVRRCGWNGRKMVREGCSQYFGHRRLSCPWCGKLRGPEEASEWNPTAVEHALTIIARRDMGALEHYFGDALLTVSGVLRGMFIAKHGHELISSDFTAIEGVVIAAVSGEQWRLDLFRAGGKIYEQSASKITGIPYDELMAYKDRTGSHHWARNQVGKVAELACGFGGRVGAWRAFGGEGTDDEIKEHVDAWRAASPTIPYLWGDKAPNRRMGIEGAMFNAIENPGHVFHVLRADRSHTGVSYVTHGDVLYCHTPGGGRITYHQPRIDVSPISWKGKIISYMTNNTNPKMGKLGWVRMDTYGPKATENVIQKVARDIQMHAIDNVERAGVPVVMHTYDEIVGEIPAGSMSVPAFEALMCDLPPFAKGWPIFAAGGWTDPRYRKG